MRWRFHGAHRGAFHSVQAAGRAHACPAMSTLRPRDGFIADERAVQDEFGPHRQHKG